MNLENIDNEQNAGGNTAASSGNDNHPHQEPSAGQSAGKEDEAGEWDQETEFEELETESESGTGSSTASGQEVSGVADQDGSPLLTLGKTDPFEIQVVEDKLRVEPQNNGTYRIFLGGDKIAVIYAQSAGDQVVWETMDDINPDFLQQIGELITEHNMG
ncbi:hypothetical protein [Pedobacter sp. SYP-B3415]|uniref:hypothetical protein n=1 Tax=Pedobacter sp. SYP-B3415 TaxID=2496641 RepID=UPI00101B881E|nr:hypothetical protein [Pedobacter sp. SYP-B3415]